MSKIKNIEIPPFSRKNKSLDDFEKMLCDMRNKAATEGTGVEELQQISKEIKKVLDRLEKLEFERKAFGIYLKTFIEE